jgi:hypothetical protein
VNGVQCVPQWPAHWHHPPLPPSLSESAAAAARSTCPGFPVPDTFCAATAVVAALLPFAAYPSAAASSCLRHRPPPGTCSTATTAFIPPFVACASIARISYPEYLIPGSLYVAPTPQQLPPATAANQSLCRYARHSLSPSAEVLKNKHKIICILCI